ALRARLEGPGVEVVGEGLGLEAAPVRTDVVVLDGARGLARPAATAAVEERLPAVVAGGGDDRLGPALGVLRRRGGASAGGEAAAAELGAAVAAAAAGLIAVPAPRAGRILGGPAAASPGEPDAPAEPLTPREREVLDLLGLGLSNRRIAE